VKIRIPPTFKPWVKVPRSCILSLAVGPDVTQSACDAVIGVEVSQILNLWISNPLSGLDEVLLWSFRTPSAVRDINRTSEAVFVLWAGTVVSFKLVESTNQFINFLEIQSRPLRLTFFKYGNISSLDHPGVFQESKSNL
jgi:hypothetical protein